MKLRRAFAAVAIAGVAGLGLTACASGGDNVDNSTFSQGIRTGQVTKISFRDTKDMDESGHNPNCKGWEGEMAMANSKMSWSISGSSYNGTGYVEGGGSGGNTFAFSVAPGRDDIVAAIQKAAVSEDQVVLEYNQVRDRDECKQRTDYLIIGVADIQKVTGTDSDGLAKVTVLASTDLSTITTTTPGGTNTGTKAPFLKLG